MKFERLKFIAVDMSCWTTVTALQDNSKDQKHRAYTNRFEEDSVNTQNGEVTENSKNVGEISSSCS